MEGVIIMKQNQKKIPTLYESKEECCGCTACYAVCPQNAISMLVDKEGFEYPIINKELCIYCRMCVKVCPINFIYKEY